MARESCRTRRARGAWLLLVLTSCATPSDVKEASAEQVALLAEMQLSLRELEDALGATPKVDAAALAERLAAARDEAPPDGASPSERLRKLIDGELVASIAGADEPAERPAPEAGFAALLRTQLALLASAGRVVDRYLATDVFGDAQVLALRDLVENAQEGLR